MSIYPSRGRSFWKRRVSKSTASDGECGFPRCKRNDVLVVWITKSQCVGSINVCNDLVLRSSLHTYQHDMPCHAYKHDTEIHSTVCVLGCLIWYHDLIKDWHKLCNQNVLVHGCVTLRLRTGLRFESCWTTLHTALEDSRIHQTSLLLLVSTRSLIMNLIS